MAGDKIHKFPLTVDNISVKKLVHEKLKGYREYEISRKIFDSDIDYNFYKAVEENSKEDLKEILQKGHSPNRIYKQETLRLITRDNVYIDNFEKFSNAIKAYEITSPSQDNISIVEKIRETNSLLTLALKNESLDICNLLLKNGANPNVKDQRLHFLSDYSETPSLYNVVSNIGRPYLHVLTITHTHTPIITPLIENSKIHAIKSIMHNSKVKVDLNEPKIEIKKNLTPDGLKTHKTLTRPVESAIGNCNNQLANYLIIRGASIYLASPDYRKAYRNIEPEMDKAEFKNSLAALFDKSIEQSKNDSSNIEMTL